MEPKAKILVIDDEEIVCKSCKVILEQEGYEVETRTNSVQGLNLVKDRCFNLVLCDLKMPKINGMEVLRDIQENCPDVSVIIITGYATVASAVEALKSGAVDYITKPFTPEQLTSAVEMALKEKFEKKQSEDESLENVKFHSEGVIGQSAKMQEVFRMVAKVAGSSTTVLLRGESGTGKDVIAKLIHHSSRRNNGPFVAIDCGAIAESLIESELFGYVKGAFTGAESSKLGAMRVANGGTLFLDEVGNLTLPAQMKLLRAIEEKQVKPLGSDKVEKVNVRLIAATNLDLEEMVEKKRFRQDLYWRLSVFVINLPPLRERKEDIPPLAMHFLKKYSKEIGKEIKRFSAEAMSKMIVYSWPGNVRELENTVIRAIHMAEGNIIGSQDLPERITENGLKIATCIPRTSKELKEAKKQARERSVAEIERSFVIEALERNNWNVTQAANDVGMARQNFQSLMRKYSISGRTG